LQHGEEDVQQMVASYAQRRRVMVDGLQRIGLACGNPRGAFYAFPSIASTCMTSEAFAEQLLFEEKVAVVPGNAFGAAGEGFVRCAYCTAQDKIEEALVRIERFVQRHA
jgi:aminotransferase